VKAYLAGPSSELGRVVMLARRLELAGVEISHRWWLDVIAREGTPDSSLSPAAQLERARRDMRGIDAADIVWALFPARTSHGLAFEMGYAHANCKHVVVSGAFANTCIFASLFERHDSDYDALEAVLAYAAERSPLAVVP
jgi:nucleoside 2-deoxyribosyltransferase